MDTILSAIQKTLPSMITIRPPDQIWENHPTLLIAEIFFYVVAILTLSHACRHGGRYLYLWIAVLMHGFLMEFAYNVLPQLPRFYWHAQASIMLFGGKMPLYIVFVYHALMYVAMVSATKLRLGSTAEAMAAGLLCVVLDYPLEILGVKLLWWTWHDTDSQFSERHLNAPWLCYIFQAVATSSFVLVFHSVRGIFARHRQRFESANCLLEALVAILTPALAVLLWMLKIIVFYHVLHDKLHLHTEICALVLLSLYTMVTWSADRNPGSGGRANKGRWLDEIGFVSFLQFSFYILLVSFAEPEKTRSESFHQPIGPCNETETLFTPLGQAIVREKYLCLDKKSSDYFDFHCLDKVPSSGEDWYTVCGTPFSNYQDYLVTVMLSCCLGFYVFWQVLGYSGQYPKTNHQPAPHTHHQYQHNRSNKKIN